MNVWEWNHVTHNSVFLYPWRLLKRKSYLKLSLVQNFIYVIALTWSFWINHKREEQSSLSAVCYLGQQTFLSLQTSNSNITLLHHRLSSVCSRGDRSSGCGGGNRSRPIPILMGYGWWPHLFPPETRVKQVGVNGLCFSFVSGKWSELS